MVIAFVGSEGPVLLNVLVLQGKGTKVEWVSVKNN